MPRHFRRMRRSTPRNVIQSYKKVINFAPTSRTPVGQVLVLTNGVDSVAAGQTGPTDADVPTGSVIRYIEITYCFTNLLAVVLFHHMSIQLTHSGQTVITANVVGGDPQRNQVFFQKLMSLGQNQNGFYTMRFKVPPKFQRVREGDKWNLSYIANNSYTDAVQVIYKFYR